jgi:hypothetical protein
MKTVASALENCKRPVGGQKQESMQIVVVSSMVIVIVAQSTRLPSRYRWLAVPVTTTESQKMFD